MLVWPRALLNPGEELPRIVGAGTSGGSSISGPTQTVNTSGGGYWAWDFEVALTSRDKILAWRALEANLDGGATQFILPMCDERFAPVAKTQTTWSNGKTWSNGNGWVGVSTVALASAAKLRATTLRLTTALAGLRAGQHFTVVHPNKGVRLYRVAGVADDGLSFTIRPPLREAMAAGEAVDFSRPRSTMKLANPETFAARLRMNRVARATASFAEAF